MTRIRFVCVCEVAEYCADFVMDTYGLSLFLNLSLYLSWCNCYTTAATRGHKHTYKRVKFK